MAYQIKILMLAFAIAFVISLIVIPILRRRKIGQQERDDGPKSHLKKQGTPTMGGIVMILAIIIIVRKRCRNFAVVFSLQLQEVIR